MSKTAEYLERFMNGVRRRNPGEREFHKAVSEVAGTTHQIREVYDQPQFSV